MEGNILNLINKIFSNNNNILNNIINELQQIKDDSQEKKTIKRLSDIIIKMNTIINENIKNKVLIRNDISKLYEQMNKQFNELKINHTINNQEIKYDLDNNNKTIKRLKYIGQVLNGIPEGKGIMYWNNGDSYEGEWKNDKKEGKGIYYWKDGDIYEGDFKNGLSEGKGIFYYNNGDRSMGDYSESKKIGKHVILTKNGEVKTKNY